MNNQLINSLGCQCIQMYDLKQGIDTKIVTNIFDND